MIAIIDYGMGNLQSVFNALHSLGHQASIVRNPEELWRYHKIILPGVGAFGQGMENLETAGWKEVLEVEVRDKAKPFLGICLGMQMLATSSTEHGLSHGLDWIPGRVERLAPPDPALRVPHVGWNDVRFIREKPLYAGLGCEQVFYFVHSYAFIPQNPEAVNGLCNYGVDFVAGVESGNIYGTQFHPEKSHRAGLAVLNNFALI